MSMAGETQETWIKWVALTTTILAVCAAIGSLKGGSYSTRTQLLTTQESDKWSYYQAKSIKQHLYEMKREIFQVQLVNNPSPEAKDKITGMLKGFDENIAKYDKEKEDIRKKAEDLSKEQEDLKRHGGNFGLAVMFFQIAIMLSAIGSLLKQKYAWVIGLCMGAVGLVYFANGFFCFF